MLYWAAIDRDLFLRILFAESDEVSSDRARELTETLGRISSKSILGVNFQTRLDIQIGCVFRELRKSETAAVREFIENDAALRTIYATAEMSHIWLSICEQSLTDAWMTPSIAWNIAFVLTLRTCTLCAQVLPNECGAPDCSHVRPLVILDGDNLSILEVYRRYLPEEALMLI